MGWRTARSILFPILVALLVAAALPMAAADGELKADDTHKVVVKVRYKAEDGKKKPLIGAPVHLVYPDGSEVIACTNRKGIAKFRNVPADTGYMLYAGPTLTKADAGCKNWRLRNPDTNKKLFMVSVGDDGLEHGVEPTDTFAIGAEDRGRYTWSLVPREAGNQNMVCWGRRVTILGTPGNDVLRGDELRNVINARGGNDLVFALCSRDLVCGGPGNDRIFGDNHGDYLFGEAGDDDLIGGSGWDWTHGGTGDDHCEGEQRIACES